MTLSKLSDPNAGEKRDVAYSKALLRTLSFAGVKFIRYAAVDPYNKLRCKVVPIDTLKKKDSSLEAKVAFVRVVFGGLPNFGDVVQSAAGFNAQGTLIFRPDLASIRILPYGPSSAMIFGNLEEQKNGCLSEFDCRALLQNVLDKVAQDQKIGFNVGVELEFSLYDAKTNRPVDCSTFAESHTLNRQEKFITQVYDCLAQQDIAVELLHAESAPGQLELVLPYMDDPVALADNVVLARETIKAVAHLHGLKALFLPKTSMEQAGSGCHLHLSIRDIVTGRNVFPAQATASASNRESFFHGASAADISTIGQNLLEGILQHLPALLAVTLPTVNSFARIGQGCWSGHDASWDFDDKECSLRVVASHRDLAWEHVEYKLCDSQANLYLALACIIISGLDGIVNSSELRQRRQEETAPTPIPNSLHESLDCMEKDGLLQEFVGKSMMKAYLAVRRVEADRAAELDLNQEVQDALDRA